MSCINRIGSRSARVFILMLNPWVTKLHLVFPLHQRIDKSLPNLLFFFKGPNLLFFIQNLLIVIIKKIYCVHPSKTYTP